MRQVIRTFLLLPMSGAFFFAATYPFAADANYRRMPGLTCLGSFGTPTYGNGHVDETAAGLECGIVVDSTLDHHAIGSTGGLWVDLYNTAAVAAGAQVMACASDVGSLTYACGSAATGSTSAGWTNPAPGMGVWGNSTYAAWYPYVKFVPLTISDGTYVNGFYMQN